MAFIAGYLWNGSEDEGGTGQRLGRRWARVSAGHVSARRHQPGLNMLMTPSLEHSVLAFPPHLLFPPHPSAARDSYIPQTSILQLAH